MKKYLALVVVIILILLVVVILRRKTSIKVSGRGKFGDVKTKIIRIQNEENESGDNYLDVGSFGKNYNIRIVKYNDNNNNNQIISQEDFDIVSFKDMNLMTKENLTIGNYKKKESFVLDKDGQIKLPQIKECKNKDAKNGFLCVDSNNNLQIKKTTSA